MSQTHATESEGQVPAPGIPIPKDPQRGLRARRVTLGTISMLVVFGLYVFISTRPGTNAAVLPPIQDIAASFWDGLTSGTLLSAVGVSLQRVVIGYVIGTTAAILIGSLMGWFRTVESIFDPIVESLRPIPPLAYIPLLLIWFGIGEFSRISVLVIACFVTCIINVIAGIKEVPRVYIEAASTLGASRLYIFRTVALPASVPYIFTGLRIALAAAWTSLVAAELLAAQNGLGFLLQSGRQYFLTTQVMYVIVTIGFLAFCMDRIFRVIQRRLTGWSEVNR